jgi:hypothetical protein
MTTPKTSLSRFWAGLVAVLVCGYLYLGVSTPQPAIRFAALATALLVPAAIWLGSRSSWAAGLLLTLGVGAIALTAWWSLILPVAATLTLACAILARRGGDSGSPKPLLDGASTRNNGR